MIQNRSLLVRRFGQFTLGMFACIALTACGGGESTKATETANEPPASAPVTPTDPTPTEPVNTAPVFDGQPPLTAQAGVAYSFAPTSSDAENDPLTFSISGKPDWVTFDTATGALTGMPADGNVGQTDDIEITVSDGTAQDSIGPFRIQIAAAEVTPSPPKANTAPVISGTPAGLLVALQPYIFIPTATDAEGDALSFSVTNKPTWATFSTSTGQLSGTPSRTQSGTVSNIRISVSDGKLSTMLPAFSIQVQPAPLTISGTPATSVAAGSAYLFKPSIVNAGSATFTWSIVNKPAWATFSTLSGQLSGTPTSAQVGTTSNIRISVTDGKVTNNIPAFSIAVTAGPNTAPTITGTPPTTVKVGSAYSFTPTGTDANKDALTYAITNKPSWATFNESTGALTGTPGAQGTYTGIVIKVSDTSKASASLPTFSIQVTAAAAGTTNRAPTISGTPVTTAKAGTAYTFKANGQDADNDALTYSIANKPSWASFDTTNGTLSGTPTASHAGTTSAITISVTDGKATASLAAFSITVTAPATTGSATVSWLPPTQNTDGTALVLAGYRIYYGTSQTNLSQMAEVPTGGVTSYTIDDLASGKWYFSVHSYSAAGGESADSNIASKTIN